MNTYYITFRSVTFAQKGEKLLNQAGFRCTLQRTPRWMEAQGCGYCLRIWTKDIAAAAGILEKNRLPMRRIYRKREDGLLEELNP